MSSIEKAIDRLNKAKEKAQSELRSDDMKSKDTVTEHTDAPSASLGGQEKDAAEDNQEYAPSEPQRLEFQLDLAKLTEMGFLTPTAKNKILSEEYRAIKRPILMNAFGKGAAPVERGNLIAATSSLPGEGKTYTALNLALSIASEFDSTVLLIDGDILKPQLSTLLGLENQKGLTDLLHDKQTGIKDVLVSTQIPKLKIIPAGKKHENSTELLASDAMQSLVYELASRYSDRVVLFDSPPLLATSESTVLNHLMGQIIMVVEAGKTPVAAVKESLSHIHDDKVIGLVLNKTTGTGGKGSYGGYGSYGNYG